MLKFWKSIALLGLTAAILFSCSVQNDPVSSENTNTVKADGSIASSNTVRKIVVLKSGSGQKTAAAFIKAKGGKILRHFTIINAISISLPSAASDKAIAAITNHADVLRIDDDVIVSAPKPKEAKPGNGHGGHGGGGSTPPPPQTTPWGILQINADDVWGTQTGSGVNVGVLDTGIDPNHPDLKANVYGGVNFTKSKSWADDNGHGTHVAGTIAAINNNEGVVGVAPEANLYAVKVLSRNGTGWLSWIIAGLEWCESHNIDVINMSLSATSDVQSFHDAIDAAHDAGITLVAAAGNSGSSTDEYPAGYSTCIAVSATDSNNDLAYFSNYGSEIVVAAPGVKILSTYKGGGYKTLSGTSMASPHVCGVAALIIAEFGYNGTDAPGKVETRLKSTAVDLHNTSYFGAGLVDAYNAVTQ